MKFGYVFPKRIEIINELSKVEKGSYTYPLRFQGKMQLFQVLSVSIDMPKYRLRNGRTRASQQEYIKIHDIENISYFSSDWEVDDKQQAQHEILKTMLVENEIDLLKFFEKREQDEPIILDSKGYVLNGNRRLCTFRELYYNDMIKYNRFKHIQVIILPPCEEIDLDELEANLQIIKDIKAEYDWVNLSCLMRDQQEQDKYSHKEIAKLHGIDVKEVIESIDKLDIAEKYLRSRCKDKMYSFLKGKDFAFQQVLKGRKELKDSEEVEKDIFQSISFRLIDNPEAGLGRNYGAIPKVKKYLNQIEEELMKEINLDDYECNSYTEDIQLGLFGGKEENQSKMQLGKLVAAINNDDNNEKIIEIVKEVVERQTIIDNEKNKDNFVIKQIIRATTSLTDALNAFDSTTVTDGIDSQLSTIEELISRIRKKVV